MNRLSLRLRLAINSYGAADCYICLKKKFLQSEWDFGVGAGVGQEEAGRGKKVRGVQAAEIPPNLA